MAAENETRLLSRIVRDRSLLSPLERGVTSDWFVVPEDKAVWKFLHNHWMTYGEVPTLITAKDNYPNYRFLKVDDSVEYLLDQLADYRTRQSVGELIRDQGDAYTSGPDGWQDAILLMKQGLNKLESERSSTADIDLVATADARWADYLVRKELPNGMRGVATGISMVDKATSGLQKGQLVTLIAPPKTGKSTLALQIAKHVHDQGLVPLFQSFEMSNQEQESRYDAMRAHVAHHRLLNGTLDSLEVIAFREALNSLKESENPFWLSDAVTAMTVSTLSAKIQSMKPDIVFVDGVYLMVDEDRGESGTPQSITNITRSLKRLAQKLEIPIVISTQVLTWKMKGKKVSADSIGYSSSFYQDSDVIISLERPEDDNDSIRILRIVASRNCGPEETMMNWNWETGTFAEFVDGDADHDDD